MEYSLNGSEGFPTPAVLSSFADVNPDSFLVGLWECRYRVFLFNLGNL
jgi:hypothetical protein